ncbi:DUF1659 domain-containing protein [Niallia sp. XMNu-256]|uniref:DUF1659 domain-containing protein n=1 Tax=Niallia sp. XMNu-256 TaxID=3082444 RepID=UPI0030D392ED
MAILVAMDSKLRLVYETGIGEGGKPIYKAKSYGNIVEGVTANQLQQVAQALASLSNDPLSGIQQSELHEVI